MLALLSNINCDHVIRRLQKTTPCLDPVGYGNVLEPLLDSRSAIYSGKAEQIVIIIDIRELAAVGDYAEKTDWFFQTLEGALRPDIQYFVSDAVYYLPIEDDYRGDSVSSRATRCWNERLRAFVDNHKQAYIFPLSKLVYEMGEREFFSDKLWYLGSARISVSGAKSVCREVERLVRAASGNTKKALIIDLDNTLWGGVVGECGASGVELSDSGTGKAFKEFQQAIKALKDSGTLIAIVSKNNEADAWEVFDRHPHMVLGREDISAFRINWESKSENIRSIKEELNIGYSSMVFIDDSAFEREEVRKMLPEIAVPEFPSEAEDLLSFAKWLAETYFTKLEITTEDREKTRQYRARREIEELKNASTDLGEFLSSLKITATARNVSEHMDRAAQLVAKTNQFNTTVTRYTRAELEEMARSPKWRLFIYEIEDKFINHGLCVFVVVGIGGNTAVIEDFIMSCRVMGRKIEYGILSDIEKSLEKEGITTAEAVFRRGDKNAPVAEFFDMAGYEVVEESKDKSEKRYRRDIRSAPAEGLFFGEVR